MVRLAASPNTCKYCMFWHILKSCISTFSFSKGWEQISFGSWQQGAGRKEESEAVGWGHCGGLVASMANVPAVNNLIFFILFFPPSFFFFFHPIHPTDVSLSLSCPQAILVNDLCIISESLRWQLNLFTAQNCWCVHRECSVGVCARKERAGWKGNEGKRDGGRERRKRNVKVTLFCLENQKGGQINCWLYLVLWISGNEAAPSYSSRCTYHFERLKNEECSDLYCIYTLFCGKNVNKYTERLQSLPI